MGRVIEAGDADFDAVTQSEEWVLVDFWAPWCGPCKMIAPVLEQIAGEREMTIAKVNTDINQLSAGKYGIRGFPPCFCSTMAVWSIRCLVRCRSPASTTG